MEIPIKGKVIAQGDLHSVANKLLNAEILINSSGDTRIHLFLDSTEPEELARMFHEAYERLAPEHGYKTREASAKPWDQVPEQNKNLMIAVAREILNQLRS